ncbi:MAG TPA: 2OG-Fe(II) oxygenase [Bryobacteraceae bacterium]|nr:2OG-Fe(II) oxygenase [Bryobacteraceae bacterium]
MALETLLHPSVIETADALREQFESAQPFKHIVIDRFLNDAFCNDLMRGFPAFDLTHAVNERGETGRKSAIPDLPRLGEPYARFDALIRSREFLDWTGRVTGIANLLYDPEYIGGGTHENLHGQDLDSHVDFNYHPQRHWHRRLNLIVFLNPQWHADWGGCLELLADPWTQDGARPSTTVVPLANRAVIFETNERSWHGFRRIELPSEAAGISRRSIAVYFYTRERPATEVAPSHGTFYVQRPVSDRIQPGYTLAEQDVDELRALVERRDAQIKFLYERELEFSDALASVVQSRAFRLGHALTWPARAAKKLLRG